MSVLEETVVNRAVDCAIEVCWRQWRALAAAGLPLGDRPVASVVDPEALVLLSLAVHQHERRLDDQLLWWADAGGSLMSVQRTRTLLADFPERLRREVAWFAAMAVDAGHQRWRVLVDRRRPGPRGRPGKGPGELQLLEPATLMLRLRAGFGVGAKADLLSFLIGVASATSESSAWSTAEVIAKAISYSVASTRRAATEMTLARLVDTSADRPVQYSVDVAAWARVLQLYQPAARGKGDTAPVLAVPPWRFWSQMSSFLTACIAIADEAALAKAAPVVQASHLRDLAERFRRPLAWNGIEWVDPRQFAGERYLDAFGTLLDRVVAWTAAKA